MSSIYHEIRFNQDPFIVIHNTPNMIEISSFVFSNYDIIKSSSPSLVPKFVYKKL